MGILDQIEGRRVYLDANILIYAQERLEPFASSLSQLFAAIDSADLHSVTSELTIAECLAKPFADGNADLVRLYQETLVSDETLTVFPVTRRVIVGAAELRGSRRLRLPDAIHAATALEAGCETFITNDFRFRSLNEINAIVLSDV